MIRHDTAGELGGVGWGGVGGEINQRKGEHI